MSPDSFAIPMSGMPFNRRFCRPSSKIERLGSRFASGAPAVRAEKRRIRWLSPYWNTCRHNGLDTPLQIFATDASEVLDRHGAQRRLSRHAGQRTFGRAHSPLFRKNGARLSSVKESARHLVFARQNLSSDPPFSHIDILSCRNVLIYFNQLLQRQVMTTFHYALEPAGYMILGMSESLREYGSMFITVDRKNKIYSKIGSSYSTGLDLPRYFARTQTRTLSPSMESYNNLAGYGPAAVGGQGDSRPICAAGSHRGRPAECTPGTRPYLTVYRITFGKCDLEPVAYFARRDRRADQRASATCGQGKYSGDHCSCPYERFTSGPRSPDRFPPRLGSQLGDEIFPGHFPGRRHTTRRSTATQPPVQPVPLTEDEKDR